MTIRIIKIMNGSKIVKKAIQFEIWCASATTPTVITKDQIPTTGATNNERIKNPRYSTRVA